MDDKDFIKKVFQQATDEFEIEFNPIAWERMEKKLDRSRRKRVLFYWLRLGSLAAIILLFGWLFWQKINATENKSPNNKPANPVAETQKNVEEPCIESKAIEKEIQNIRDSNKVNPQVFVNKGVTRDSQQSKNPSGFTKHILEKAKHAANANTSGVALQEKFSKMETPFIVPQKGEATEKPGVIGNAPIENIAGIDLNSLKSEQTKPSIVVTKANFDSNNVVLPNRVRHNHWTLGLSVAPETASVGLNSQSKWGYSFGMLAEYRFAKRFSFNLQGVYAQKSYLAEKGSFHRAGGWPHDLEPIETYGNCNMLEATLSLRTEILQRQCWNLVATTGISSWWMLHEAYDYEYEGHYPGLIYYWESDQTRTYWWSMAQVGIGGELKLSQKLSAQADLYMQIPLQGVGRGSVQLYSQGLSLSLRRHF